ncbi:MAG: DUF1214 domain-containing protein [Notoacmeibacter sp.]|nr:DUF1214 domain-containing protein [Notoacmeibacter sp.]MCC0033560.1 DUF1214 domain-containing protein [Brucellaceae bacterium]
MLRNIIQIAVILALAFGGGIWSVRAMLERAVRPGSVTVSAWTAYPVAGTPAADPYTKAHIARNGELPLGAGEGLTFAATKDSAGDAITGNCSYRIEGQMPASRLWTLHAEGFRRGQTPVEGLPDALHSRRVLYGPDGGVRVLASAAAQPDNWLAIPSEGPLSLVLTFYDTELASGSRAYEAEMPQILKVGCDG